MFKEHVRRRWWERAAPGQSKLDPDILAVPKLLAKFLAGCGWMWLHVHEAHAGDLYCGLDETLSVLYTCVCRYMVNIQE